MSSTKATLNPKEAIRFSRVMHLRWVVAMGLSISVGLGIFTLLGPFIQMAGRQSLIGPILLLAITSIPIILTYSERLAVIPGSSGAYNLARTSGWIWLTYASGWLLLSGYATVVALLGWGAAIQINLFAETLFNHSLNLTQLAGATIGIIALGNIFSTNWWTWRSRSIYIYISVIFILAIALWAIIEPSPSNVAIPYIYNSSSILPTATLMFAGLWGLQFILNSRDEIHRPTKTLLNALLIMVGVATGLGVLAGLAILEYQGLPQTLTPLLDISPGILPSGFTALVYAILGLLVCVIGLNQGLVNALRLLGDMTRDGFFPEKIQVVTGQYHAPIISLALFTLISIALIIFFPIIDLIAVASLVFLWVTALVHIPDAFRSKPNLPEKRFPKLPFHPLFPWLTIAIGVFQPFNLKFEAWVTEGVWILIGLLIFVVYARQKGQSTHRQQVVIGDTTDTALWSKSEYVVMVGIANPKTAATLLSVGARLAKAKNGKLLALNVLTLPEQIPPHLKQKVARKGWETLSGLIQDSNIKEIKVTPLVRLAPTPSSGILETVGEENVDLLLVGWEGDAATDDAPPDSIIDPVLKWAACQVAVVKGDVPQTIKQVLVPTAGGSNAPVALALGKDLTEPDNGHIFVENIVTDHFDPERETQANAVLGSTQSTAPNGSSNNINIEQRVIQADTVTAGIVREAQKYDVLMIGATKEGAMGRTYFGGLPVEVATTAITPAILIRAKFEKHHWIFLLWEKLVDSLPTLTLARQQEVYLQMHESAQPSVDFFVLITLASMIATLGLLQNSAAVIIGAMLVAPLMSPILAMAMGMVHGNLRLLLIAAEATTKGIVLAIIVGLAVVLFSPLKAPTTEILARTQPNILDLMVALASGAAAGYALSRKEVAAALPGVAISAALVPPLCVVGYGIGTSQLDIAAGSLLLFITNLIAIIFAAAITFLALGFHPTPTDRGELIRGLQVTLVSLGVIFVILAFTTITTTTELSLQVQVEQLFNNEIVARAGEITEFALQKDGDGYVIHATVINIEENQLTANEISKIEDELTRILGGPVVIEATMIPGSRKEIGDNFNTLRQLENQFRGKIIQQGGQVINLNITEDDDGYKIEAAIIFFEPDENTPETDQAEIIRQELSEIVDTPVTLHMTIIPGTQINADPPTPIPVNPTPEP